MYRSAERVLAQWFATPQRKPLVIRGARQVGKSTLVRQFAQSHHLHLNEINLERHPDLEPIFQTLDLTRIRRELEGLLGQSLLASNSVLFLDEIQATPHALPALRYFLEDHPRLPVIAAGSLLEFVLSQHAFTMPVGRIQYFHLGPMSFEEFLAEVDYAIARGARIVPVEVKAGTSGTLRSLHQFALAKGTRLAVRFDLNPPTVQPIRHQVSGTRQNVEMTLLSLPLYLVGQLGRLLDRLRQER